MTIYKRQDEFIVFRDDVIGISVPKNSDEGKEIASYLLDHPEALQPEPLPPPPSPEQLEAQAEAQRQAYFAEYDKAIAILNNQVRRGSITQEVYDERLAAWDSFATALELVNDAESWYIDTVWPDKPVF